VPRFNRERKIAELLRSGRAPLTIRSWDTPGVLAAGLSFAEALEFPPNKPWDSTPPDVTYWRALVEEGHWCR
jgi:hypothetical protein